MENQYDKLINFWAVITMVALILSAVSLFFFRYYSGKKNKEQFSSVETKITNEVQKSITEISQTKDAINTQLELEASQIITNLRQKADETTSVLEDVIVESKTVTDKIKNDLETFKVNSERELSKITTPIGFQFSVRTKSFSYSINPNNLPEFRAFLKSDTDFKKRARIHPIAGTTSVQLNTEILPKDVSNLFLKKMSTVAFIIIENEENDLTRLDKILAFSFNLSNTKKISSSYDFIKNPSKEIIQVSMHTDSEEVMYVHKYKNVYSTNEICGKLAIVSSSYGGAVHRSPYPYDMMFSFCRIRDELNNVYEFRPIRNVQLYNEESFGKEFYTLGRLTCAN